MPSDFIIIIVRATELDNEVGGIELDNEVEVLRIELDNVVGVELDSEVEGLFILTFSDPKSLPPSPHEWNLCEL